MANQKLEDQLSLALDTPAQMREKSDNLDTGYAPSENTWELIVKYNGNLDRLTGGIRVEPLIAGYAIVTIPENLIGAFSRMEEIEFIEKPKKLYPQVTAGLGASCFYPLLQPVSGKALSGQGVYMAILDSGHCFSREVGELFGFLKQNNVYFLIENEKEFIDFRMRSGQKHLFSFN